ncbi:MAG TPA: c-type cytochrome [Terracidiphilus sp.]|nr:c-type cytochrome [Terracidiphilus sp.]
MSITRPPLPVPSVPISALAIVALAAAALAVSGCKSMPGYPKPGPEIPRPDAVLDFPTLYKESCSGCHGENGLNGAALALNNPAYLAVAGPDNLRKVTANGVPSTLMPPFARSAGGMLTDQQVDAIVQGMLKTWGRPADFASVALPPYAATAPGNPEAGQKVFLAACARCHGDDGAGLHSTSPGHPANPDTGHGSIVNPSFLALVSDQGIRSFVLAGHANQHIPDWRGYLTGPGAHPLSPQEISDVVAWVAGHRQTAVAPAAGSQSASTSTASKLHSPTPHSPAKEKP